MPRLDNVAWRGAVSTSDHKKRKGRKKNLRPLRRE
jgi:hypothetical protein